MLIGLNRVKDAPKTHTNSADRIQRKLAAGVYSKTPDLLIPCNFPVSSRIEEHIV